MRKVLASALSVSVASVPAVAYAATNDDNNTNVIDKTAQVAPQSANSLQLRDLARNKIHANDLRGERKHKRAERKKARKRAKQAGGTPQQAQGVSTASAPLQAIAACESGGNPGAVGGGGSFRGKYQFDYATWASVGGSGDPASAPEAEQDKRAAMLYAKSGSSPWPVCGQ